MITRRTRLLAEAVTSPSSRSSLLLGSTAEGGSSEDEGGSGSTSSTGAPRKRRRTKRKPKKISVETSLPRLLGKEVREGTPLSAAVFGDAVLDRLPSEDKGPRLSH
jgi:hypothetical protein